MSKNTKAVLFAIGVIAVIELAILALRDDNLKPNVFLNAQNGELTYIMLGQRPRLLVSGIVVPADMSGEYRMSEGEPGIIWLSKDSPLGAKNVAYFATVTAPIRQPATRIDIYDQEFENLTSLLRRDSPLVLQVVR